MRTAEKMAVKSGAKKMDFKFKVLNNDDKGVNGVYTAGCSGGRSDCCSRVCGRYGNKVNSEQWGRFLEVNAGVVQY